MSFKKIFLKTPKSIRNILIFLILSLFFSVFLLLNIITKPGSLSNEEINSHLFTISDDQLNKIIEDNEESNSIVGKAYFRGGISTIKINDKRVLRKQLVKQARRVREAKIILRTKPLCLPNKKFSKYTSIIKFCSNFLNEDKCNKNLFLSEKHLINLASAHESCLVTRNWFNCINNELDNLVDLSNKQKSLSGRAFYLKVIMPPTTLCQWT